MTPLLSVTVFLYRAPKQLTLNIQHEAVEQDTVRRMELLKKKQKWFREAKKIP